jgi:hypothetical protein
VDRADAPDRQDRHDQHLALAHQRCDGVAGSDAEGRERAGHAPGRQLQLTVREVTTAQILVDDCERGRVRRMAITQQGRRRGIRT